MKTLQSIPKIKFKLPKIWPVVASALLLAVAFPPFNISLLVFVAVAPFIAYIRDNTLKANLKAGYLFGVIFFGSQLHWISTFVTKYLGNPIAGMIPWLLATFLGSIFFLILAWLIHLCFQIRFPHAIPIVWAAVEGLRAFIPILAFPWGFIAHPLWIFPWLVQHAAYGTIILVSAWVVIFNLIIAQTLLQPEDSRLHAPVQHLFRYGMVMAGLFALGSYRMSALPATTLKTITGGQPGVDMAFTTPEQEAEQLTDATYVLEDAAVAQKSDLLILPEGYAGSVYQLPPLTPLGPNPRVPVIMGGQRFADDTSYQSAIYWDGTQWDFADKTRLVIMGEYVPFRDQLPFLKNFNVALEDLSPGPYLKTPEINGMKIGPLICFEGVFPDLAAQHCLNGAQVLIQMSIDDWYEETPAYQQLWQSSVWRSIESGLPIVRVGARGQSLFTDYRGRIANLVPVGKLEPFRANVKVPAKSDAFPYRIAFVYLCWISTALIFAKWAVQKIKNPARKSSKPDK